MQVSECAPRACGDGPWSAVAPNQPPTCSPRVRGWSRKRPARWAAASVLPARAGLVPLTGPARSSWGSAPRACGDGPPDRVTVSASASCSPRVRGWSQQRRRQRRRGGVLPARAGMVPGLSTAPLPDPCAPRACGDGPASMPAFASAVLCSPRVRGWSPVHQPDVGLGTVLPARAGMVPRRLRRSLHPLRAPRACGDGPYNATPHRTTTLCSPRVQGWSRQRPVPAAQHPVLPTRAGMVPAASSIDHPPRRAPRACGDGPPRKVDAPQLTECSPRVRG